MEIAALTVSLNADLVPLNTALMSLNARFTELGALVADVGKVIDKAFAGEVAKQTRLQASLAATATSLEAVGTTGTSTGSALTAAFGAQAVELGAIGAAAKEAAAGIASMKAAQSGGAGVVSAAGAEGVAASVESATSSLASFGTQLRTTGTMLSMYLTAPLALLGGLALHAAGDFEQAMARIQGTFNLPATSIKQLSDLAVKLGADITLPNTSAVDASHALQQLMASGLSMKDAMNAARPVLQLSAVALIDNKDAALITAQALNAYRMAGTEAVKVTDLLVNGMRATGAGAEDFAKGLTNVGPAALLANQNINDMATGIAMLVRSGMTAPAAGTALTTMFLRLANPTSEARKLLDQFHISVRNLDGTMKPMPAIFEEFRNKLGASATVTRAFGGDTKEVNKHLKEAETAFKAAQKVLHDMPITIASQSAHLTELNRQLTNVNEPARKLTETIGDQKTKLALLTTEMIRHNTEGLEKLARGNADAKGRIQETTFELHDQVKKLQELKKEAQNIQFRLQLGDVNEDTGADRAALREKQGEILKLTNSIRINRENVADWGKEIANNDRQLKAGLDTTKDKQLGINQLTQSLKENQAKLDDWNKAGEAAKTADLNAAINKLNQELDDNKTKLTAAASAQDALSKARANAQLVTVKMDQAERDHIVGQIFGQRGFKPIEIAMHFNPAAFNQLKQQITEVGTTNRIATTIQQTMNGKLDGLRSSAENAALTLGNKLMPVAKQFIEWLTNLLERLNGVSPRMIAFGVAVAGVAAAAGPALLIIGNIIRLLPALAGPLGIAVAAIGLLATAWATNFGGIREKTAAFVTWIKPYLQAAWTSVSKDFTAAWGAIQQFGKQIWPDIQKVMQGFAAFMKAHGAELVATVTAAWTLIKGVVQVAWGLISGVLKIGLAVLNGDWGKAWKGLGDLVKTVWDGIVNVVKGGVTAVAKLIEFAGNGIFDAIERIVRGMVKIGSDLVQGLINGIGGMVQAAIQAGLDLGNKLADAIRSALGIRSPSAVMHAVGVNIGQGLVNGINSQKISVGNAMAALVNTTGDWKQASNQAARNQSAQALFASQVVAAQKAYMDKQNLANGIAGDAASWTGEQQYLNQLRHDVTAGNYSSLNVGGQTLNRQDSAQQGHTTSFGDIHINVNGVQDAASFQLSRGQILQAMYEEMQSFSRRNG